MSEPPCDKGGQLIDDVMIMDMTSAGNNTAPAAGNNNTMSAAGNNRTSASNKTGPSQEISWRADE